MAIENIWNLSAATMSNCNKSITHNKIASFVKSIKSSTQLVLRQICTEGKHTQYQWTKQGLKGEQICQKQGCFIRPPLTGQRHKLMLPYPRFCSGVAGFAGAGDGVSLLSGLGKKLGPISPARQPSADRSCQNPLPSYFLTKLPFFVAAFLPKPPPHIFSGAVCDALLNWEFKPRRTIFYCNPQSSRWSTAGGNDLLPVRKFT